MCFSFLSVVYDVLLHLRFKGFDVALLDADESAEPIRGQLAACDPAAHGTKRYAEARADLLGAKIFLFQLLPP